MRRNAPRAAVTFGRPTRALARCLSRAPALMLALVVASIVAAALAIRRTPNAMKIDTSLESFRARGTERTARAVAVAVARRETRRTPSVGQSRRRILLSTDESEVEEPPAPSAPPVPLMPPIPPPPPPYHGPTPTRRLVSSLDRMILGVDSKFGVDGGGGKNELHVIVSSAAKSADDIANALRATCGLKHVVENSNGFADVSRDDPSTFSVFDIESALRVAGIQDVFESAQTLGEGSPNEVSARLSFIRGMCAYRDTDSFDRERVQSAHTAMCANVRACHPASCEPREDLLGAMQDARCMIGEYKIGICDFMDKVDPTTEEVLAVASINKRLGKLPCQEIDFHGEIGTLIGIRAILRWSSSWSLIEAFGAPFEVMLNEALLSDESGSLGARLIFRLRESHGDSTSWVMNVARHVIDNFNADISSVMSETSATWRFYDAYDELVDQRLANDSLFAIASLCITVALIALSTRSVSIALGGVLSIVGAIALTHAMYFGVFERRWIGTIHVAGVFLAIGVGADDIFVICEHWRESAHRIEPQDTKQATLEARMEWTMSNSLFSIGITSITTAAAFASNCASRIPPVRLFGTYMATLILLLLCVTIVVIGSVLALNEKFDSSSFSWRRILPLPRAIIRPAESQQAVVGSNVRRRATIDLGEFPIIERMIHRRGFSEPRSERNTVDRRFAEERPLMGSSESTSASSSSTSPVASPRTRRRRPLLERVLRRVFRWKWTLLACYAASIVFAVLTARKLLRKSGDESISMWPKGHVIHAFAEQDATFKSSGYGESVLIHFAFGVDALGTSATATKDKTLQYRGTPILLKTPGASYDFSAPESQQWLLSFCASLHSESIRAKVLSDASINCWIQDMDVWLRDGGLSGAHLDGLPVGRSEFREALRSFAFINMYGTIRFINSAEDCATFRPGDDLCVAYSAISVMTSTRRMTTPEEIQRTHDFWSAWFASKITDGPLETVDAFPASDAWVIADTVQEIKNATPKTILYSLLLAFVILLVSTRSLVTSLLAAACITSVICYFAAFMALRGWRFGIIEAVCVQIIVGLSIDYPCHISVAYVATRHRLMSRQERALAAVKTVGGAVAAGWLSSVAAAACLLGCVIVFFTKFASFICVTLTASFVLAIVILPVALATVGPEFRTGSLTDST